MKKRTVKKTFTKLLAGACMIAMLVGCGGSKEASDRTYSNGSNSYAKSVASESYVSKDYASDDLWSEAESYELADAGTTKSSSETYNKTSASKRKLIKNVNMGVETQEYDTLMENIEARIKELGGYVQNLESYNGSRYNSGNYRYNDGYYTKRTATMVIRIPQEKLDDFVVTVTDLAHVTDRRESVEDVTLQYVDVKSHKESLEVEQARLLELLERAESLDDIITLENRLTNVRYQIESMESTLRTYDDLVDYSTVNLRIEEVEVYTPVEAGKETNWERMVNGLVQSLTDVRDGAINFVIWVVIHLPYLVIWAIVITIAAWIIKKKFKPKKAVQKAKEEKKD